MPLRALALVCTVKPSPAPSTSEDTAWQLLDEFAALGVGGDAVRVGDADAAWFALRDRILAADIVVMATPTGSVAQMSTAAQRMLKQLPSMAGKVAVAAVEGDGPGARNSVADLFQVLDEVGFTIPVHAPLAVSSTAGAVARDATQLALLLQNRGLRGSGQIGQSHGNGGVL